MRGDDKRGWSLRNHVVYPFLSEAGEVIAFVGRDLQYEEKLRAFAATEPDKRDADKWPMKHRFPKGFHRGVELFGQQSARLRETGFREAIGLYGIIVVEGFNDVIRLDNDGIPAVAICSNVITEEQVQKLGRWSRSLRAPVTLMFDCDAEGERGAVGRFRNGTIHERSAGRHLAPICFNSSRDENVSPVTMRG